MLYSVPRITSKITHAIMEEAKIIKTVRKPFDLIILNLSQIRDRRTHITAIVT